MLAGIVVFGVVDGSLWRVLLTPTIAYRPGILFGLTLVFGWRGFVWSQLLFLISFGIFLGWPGAALVTPLFSLSHALGFIVVQRLARNQTCLLREKSTLAFLAGSAIAPALPALLGGPVLSVVGITVGPALPAALDGWLRGVAAILAVSPVLLVYCSDALREWVGFSSSPERPEAITTRNAVELCVEMAVWTAALWISVDVKTRYGINISYLAFIAPLSFTLLRGMRPATLILVANALIATTLWQLLHWAGTLSALDLRLLIATYSLTILVLGAVLEERERDRGQVARLLTAEAALRASEDRFRLAIKATKDAIWDIDLKSGTVTWNDTYSILYGRPETDDSMQFWIDRIHPDDRVRIVDDFQAAVGGDASSWNAEYRFRRLDGKWAYIHDRAYIAREPTGIAWRVIGAMQDLTEQKQAEAALRGSEERFRRVFEEGPLGLALVGGDYRFFQVNSALCQMVGYSEAELVQKSFIEITHPDDIQADVELAGRLFKREIPFYKIQKRYVKKTGEIIWINLTASIIVGDDGQPLHGIAMVEDITDIKRTQEDALMRQKLESLGTLAGGIAHDFNNILGAVQAQAELALEERDTGSLPKEELKAIHELAMRGAEVVRQLMIYAGTENAAIGLVDVSKIVEEMLALLKISVTKRAVINADLEQDLPAIHASAAQIRQIVMNLITNASDAIKDQEGVISVITRHVTLNGGPAARSFQALAKGDYVYLEVSDTGCGMSPQIRSKVFDPFFSTKSAGRGLGLAVVQGIVRSLRGAIHLTSHPGQGTTVEVLLPCSEITGRATGDTNPKEGDSQVRTQVGVLLIVEDEKYLRQATVKMLRKAGFQVFEAADGTSAIDFLRAHGAGIDAILLDMTLPGRSSHEIIAEAANVKPEIRIILTSAYSREMIEGSTNDPRIRGFIRKPFLLEDLLKTLRNCLRP